MTTTKGEDALAEAIKYERMAREMSAIGDFAAAGSFRTIARTYLEEAIDAEKEAT